MNEERIIQRAEELISEGFGHNKALSPDLLGFIKDILFDVIADCVARRSGTAASIRATASRPLVARLIVRPVIVQHMPELRGIVGWRKHDGDSILEAVLHTGRAAKASELRGFAKIRGINLK